MLPLTRKSVEPMAASVDPLHVDQVLTNYGVAVRETSSLQEEAASNMVAK